MMLSILIPSVFDRNVDRLTHNLVMQIGDKGIELLVLSDNRKRSTGRKRQALLDMAQGRYVTFIDDDDSVTDDYVASVYETIVSTQDDEPDVIVFNSQAQLLGYGFGENPYIVRCGIEYENEDSRMVGDKRVDITRKPWHWCIWKTALAKTAAFPDGYIDDDWYWLRQLVPKVVKQHRIDRVLHYYHYDHRKSLSAQGKPTCT